jgi:hypothetical protein
MTYKFLEEFMNKIKLFILNKKILFTHIGKEDFMLF